MNNIFYYDIKKSFDERLKEATDVLKKYPDKIPIIVEQNTKVKNPCLDRNKFLSPHDVTIGQFILILRNRLGLSSSQSIFLFVHGKTLANEMLLSDVYRIYGDTDKFLKMKYSLESFFG